MARGFYVNFKVPELNKVLNNISKYDTKTAVKIEQAVSLSTKAIARGARQRVPVRPGSGLLKKSIRSSFNTKKIQGTVGVKKFYAHFVEFGTKGKGDHPVGERPFLRPAYEDERPNLIRNVKDAVKP